MSDTAETPPTTSETPRFARRKSTHVGNFSQQVRDLPEGDYLPVPADMAIKSVRTLASKIGSAFQPVPRKYSVRLDEDGVHWVSWESTDPAPSGGGPVADE